MAWLPVTASDCETHGLKILSLDFHSGTLSVHVEHTQRWQVLLITITMCEYKCENALGVLPVLLALLLLTLLPLSWTQAIQPLVLFLRSLLGLFVFFLPLLGNAQRHSGDQSPDCETPVHQVKYDHKDQERRSKPAECIRVESDGKVDQSSGVDACK